MSKCCQWIRRLKDSRQATYLHERNVGISIIIQNNEVTFVRICFSFYTAFVHVGLNIEYNASCFSLFRLYKFSSFSNNCHLCAYHHSSAVNTSYYFVHLVWLTSCDSIMPVIPVLNFSISNKQKSILICVGFIYQLNKTRPKVKYWRCKDRTCSVYIHTDKNNHCLHLTAPESIEVNAFKENVKKTDR